METDSTQQNIYKIDGILFAQSSEFSAYQRFEVEYKTDQFVWIATYAYPIHYTDSFGKDMICKHPYLNTIYYGSDIS